MDSNRENLVQLTATSGQSESFPEWSPDGMKLAFVRGGVSVIDFETMTEVQIIEYEDVWFGWGGLSWSPDGERILFSRNDRLFTITADGSELEDLGIAGNFPAWSPSGSEIAFTRDWELFVVNADGNNERQLTESTWLSYTPRWSPDGATLVFVREDPAGSGCGLMELWTANSNGSDMVLIAETLEAGGSCGSAAIADWSPDGHSLVYEFWTPWWMPHSGGKCEGAFTSDLHVFDLTTREQVVVESQFCENRMPAWRPVVN
jgi:Tol biopolymer transport system component